MALSNETYTLLSGRKFQQPIQLADSRGLPVVGFDGSEVLTTTVWPGGDRSASFVATTTWLSPSAAQILILITAAQSATLAPGRYQLETTATAAGDDPEDVYGCTLDVQSGPGTATAPRTYTTLQDLRDHQRGWLDTILTDDDQAGFIRQQAMARDWIGDLAHAHYRVASLAMVVGGQAFGPRRSGARSQWLQEQLDADRLIVSPQVIKACAMRALAHICEGMIGGGGIPGGGGVSFGSLTKYYRSESDYIASTMTLQIDADGDGYGEIVIDLSCTDPLYG